MRKVHALSFLVAVALGLVVVGAATSSPSARSYVVVYAADASPSAARSAVTRSGGVLVRENRKVGVATVISRNPSFLAAVSRQRALYGAALDRPVGRTLNTPIGSDDALAKARASGEGAALTVASAPGPAAEPLASLQWDMAMIHATSDGSYRKERGDPGVLVGVLDTGIDGSHPDIAPNFDAALSRNFTTDIPLVDGDCADDPDGSCSDPADVDENGHGTHVAGTIASPINGFGMAGVAPNVTLVNLRAGQDSGYFFLQPTVDALTYAGDHGVDVVNMSYFIDPWLYNCASNPADSPEAQAEQRTIIEATNRALHYAQIHGVTAIAAAGNEHTDLDNPTIDEISPDYPPGSEYPRNVDNSCLDLPTEGKGVEAIVAVGPSGMKADYSNWGLEDTDVAAPGGYFRDLFGTPEYRTVATQVLGPYPLELALSEGGVDPDGTPNTPFVVRDCQGSTCAYYQYLQGTSMASPHAVGVAALIVSRWGKRDRTHGGLTLAPHEVLKTLERTATPHPCPSPPLLDYTIVGRPPEYNVVCQGNPNNTNVWGRGIVDALAAVTRRT
jgi:subtilisin family serine protease